eukprot:TRINITY_DN3353_c0_g1_i3.p1 TRINITY_DN3353_c0_g1~~TRINITY_DN3353_c0_g1_i3.p1  ORF type:complete len:247 (+),score=50.04 TRINITY_DN3353_c0_g1_i3:49-789(+)
MKISPGTVFITGCNRGIGLEIVKQMLNLATPPVSLFANYRQEPGELKELKDRHENLHLIDMDVTDYDAFPSVVKQVDSIVGSQGLNLLINNAVVQPGKPDLEGVTPEAMRTAYEVNCIAPTFLSRAMLPLLTRAAGIKPEGTASKSVHRAAIIQLSTGGASIEENISGSHYAYRASKTALNQSMKSMSVDLMSKEILVMSMIPCTDTAGPEVTAETFVTWMLTTLDQLADKDHGTFLRCDNTSVPW